MLPHFERNNQPVIPCHSFNVKKLLRILAGMVILYVQRPPGPGRLYKRNKITKLIDPLNYQVKIKGLNLWFPWVTCFLIFGYKGIAIIHLHPGQSRVQARTNIKSKKFIVKYDGKKSEINNLFLVA